MKILVSACLLGENCKYNGGNNYCKEVARFVKEHHVVTVCPEVLGGLSIPRKPAEIVDGIVRNEDGTSVDREFRTGAEVALQIAISQQVELAILQERSPSCGISSIYDGTFSGTLISGEGVFAALLRKNGIPSYSGFTFGSAVKGEEYE